MPFQSQTTPLNNGVKVLLREAELDDAAKLMATTKTYITQSEYIPKLQEEFQLTLGEEQDWIDTFLVKENALLLVAEFENEIIGNIDLMGHTRKTMQHTAVIGMGMLSAWRGLGLGTALLDAATGWAKENPLLELLWLQVYTANTSAVRLYKNKGFQENGLLKNFFKQDGQYFDNLTMSLVVK